MAREHKYVKRVSCKNGKLEKWHECISDCPACAYAEGYKAGIGIGEHSAESFDKAAQATAREIKEAGNEPCPHSTYDQRYPRKFDCTTCREAIFEKYGVSK